MSKCGLSAYYDFGAAYPTVNSTSGHFGSELKSKEVSLFCCPYGETTGPKMFTLGSGDGCVRDFDTETGKQSFIFRFKKRGWIRSLNYNPEGTLLACGQETAYVGIFDTKAVVQQEKPKEENVSETEYEQSLSVLHEFQTQWSQDGEPEELDSANSGAAFGANSGGVAVYDLVKNTLQDFAPPLPDPWLDGKAEQEQDSKQFWGNCNFKLLPMTEENLQSLVTWILYGWVGPIKGVRVWKVAC